MYPKLTIGLNFPFFYPNPKGDKRNFKLVIVQKWDRHKLLEVLSYIAHSGSPSVSRTTACGVQKVPCSHVRRSFQATMQYLQASSPE
jgi:hypothetical protein